MALNKIKQALRILFKEKRITIINIIGLSISLACALFMLLWVQHELSFDRFHNDFDRLYRVEEDADSGRITKVPFLLKKRTLLTGANLTNARVDFDQFNIPFVSINFDKKGARDFL